MNPFEKSYRYYVDSFKGFRKEVWLLALVTFINRAGSMVVPFLTLYLTADMGLNLEQVGWIMSCFGAGSIVGSWLGGKLSDNFGFYPVIAGSLLSTGLFFFVLQYLQGFYPFCIGVFILTLLSDAFRPALFVALRSYSKPENRTRAVTLIRLAINLGFSMGPAIGGLIITHLSYAGLFWIDGVTCIMATALFVYMLPVKDPVIEEEKKSHVASQSPYRDVPYIFFLILTVLITFPFVQYFSAVPLYYKEVHLLSEANIGLLLAMNGLVIFLIEMPVIKYLEERKYNLYHILSGSVLLFALSFFVLNWSGSYSILVIGMLFMTVGEMINFPFMNRFAFDRAEKGKTGAYMALFTISWSVSHIIGHNLGLHMIERNGYDWTWYLLGFSLLFAMLMVYLLRYLVKRYPL